MLRRHFLESYINQYDVLIIYEASEQIKFFGGLDSKFYMSSPTFETSLPFLIVLDSFSNGVGKWGIKFNLNENLLIGGYISDTLLKYVGSVSYVTEVGNVDNGSLVYDASKIIVNSIQFEGRFYLQSLIEFLGPIKENISSITLPNELIKIGDYAFDDMFNLTQLVYKGTTKQWNNLEKGVEWNRSTLLTEVQCSDGIVML